MKIDVYLGLCAFMLKKKPCKVDFHDILAGT